MEPVIPQSELASSRHAGESDDFFPQEKKLAQLRLIWAKRRLLGKFALSGLIVATLVAFLIPKRYESTAQLMPPDSQSSTNLALLAGLTGPGGLGMLAGDLLGVKSTGALFVGVLRSRTVADHIVERFDLRRVYGHKFQVDARKDLADKTTITEDRKSGIIAVTVTDHDPKRAAAIAGAYVDELNSLIAQLSTSSARRERMFLEDRLAGVKVDLEAAEKDFSQFASTKGAIDIPQQGKAMVEAAATLEGELIAARSELEGLKQIYTDNNVRVRTTQARINELREQLRRLGGTTDQASHDASDSSASDTPYPTLRQLPILGVPFADKLRRMKVQEAVFETLTKQYELAKVQEAKEIPSLRVLDVPVVPEHKSFPPRLEIVTIGFLIATVAGLIWVLGEARWREIAAQDPTKIFVEEVFQTLTANLRWTTRNGHEERVAATDTPGQPDEESAAKAAGTSK